MSIRRIAALMCAVLCACSARPAPVNPKDRAVEARATPARTLQVASGDIHQPPTPAACALAIGAAAPLFPGGEVENAPDFVRMLRWVDFADRCFSSDLTHRDAYFPLLRQARRAFGEWYMQSPDCAAAVLTGDAATAESCQPRAPASDGPAPEGKETATEGGMVDGRMLGEWYLRIEERMVHLLRPAGSAPVMAGAQASQQGSCAAPFTPAEAISAHADQELWWCRAPHVFLRVDAALGALELSLGRQPGAWTDDSERAIDRYLDVLGEALFVEARFWSERPLAEAGDRLADLAASDDADLRLIDRVRRVSLAMKSIAAKWGERDRVRLRSKLGSAYRTYVTELRRRAPNPDEPIVVWSADVEWPVGGGRFEQTREISLRRLEEEIGFDALNIQALFAERDAESRWAKLLGRPPDELRGAVTGAATLDQDVLSEALGIRRDHIAVSAQQLLDAFRRIDSRTERLAAAARLLHVVDLSLADAGGRDEPGTKKSAAESRVEQTAEGLRDYSSRLLAELGLCLLNDALLVPPQGHACRFPVDPLPATGPGPCSERPIREPFVPKPVAAGPTPFSVPEAYARVFSSLLQTWDAMGVPRGEKAPKWVLEVSSATRCEVAMFGGANVLGRLGADLPTYRRVLALYSSGRVEAPPPQVGALLTAAVLLAERNMQAVCDAYRPAACSAGGFDDTIRDAEKGKDGERAERFRAARRRYCDAAEHGSVLVTLAEQEAPATRTALLDTVGPFLAPLSKTELLHKGRGFKRAYGACVGKAAPARLE